MKTMTLLFATPFFITFFLSLAARPQGREDVIVAIIDTGIDTHHPLLKGHLWQNKKEKYSDSDIDGNGYAGDFHGWNFSANNNDIEDTNGHGTHIAGIILRKAPHSRIKLMILKYYDPNKSGEENLKASIEAIRYATKMKADIINYSGGGDSKSPLEEAAIRDAQKQGIVFVAAAGNEGRNTDRVGYFPAGYGLSNIITVAATDSDNKLLKTSNFGSESVDIAAPGKNIFSTLPGGKFGFMSGTSQATAWISGLVAQLLLQTEKSLSPEKVKRLLIHAATKDRDLVQKIRSQGLITSLQASLIVN